MIYLQHSTEVQDIRIKLTIRPTSSINHGWRCSWSKFTTKWLI